MMNNPFEYFRVLVSVKRNLADSVKPTTPDKQAEVRGRILAYNDIIDEIEKIEEMFMEPTVAVSFSDNEPKAVSHNLSQALDV